MAFTKEWKRKNTPKMERAEAVNRASLLWEKMSKDERQTYTPNPNKLKKGSLTCVRTSIEDELQAESDKKCKDQFEIEDIQKIIQNAQDLKHQKFYFVFINFFVPENAVPAEIALIEFSLKEGVRRQKNWYVNPDADFYGMLSLVKDHASATHQLPLPPHALGKTEPHEIYFEILEFLNADFRRPNISADCPPLYTCSTYIPTVRIALSSLVAKKKLPVKNLVVYSIQQLFYILKCATSVSKGAKPKNVQVTNTILERDPFEFEDEIACHYHQQIDRSRYCALSKVIRWAYTFASYMLNDLGLEFIPGKHCPQSTAKASNVSELCENVSEMYLDKETSRSKPIQSLEASSCNKPIISIRLDPIDSAQKTLPKTLSTPNLRSHLGRGIALLDESTVPQFGTRGRGRILGRGVAILNESSYPGLSRAVHTNHSNDSQL